MTDIVTDATFHRVLEILFKSGVPHRIHEHRETRTVDEAARNLTFPVDRLVKTIAFRTSNGAILLAALRGTRRVDYARFAALSGVNRRDLFSLSPEEVRNATGMEPGSVSPIMPLDGAHLFIDEDVLSITPTIFCGLGRPDRTLEIDAADMARLTAGRIAPFSR
ncbi:MAG: YbaK/EbsC family protein [Geobacteraceae bacterium]|nr:YbaK/EbsC family protein [Geobacteraceae bacterium]